MEGLLSGDFHPVRCAAWASKHLRALPGPASGAHRQKKQIIKGVGEILTRRAAVPQSYRRNLLAFPAFAAVAVGAKERSAERSRFPVCEQRVRASRSARALCAVHVYVKGSQ